ncbi:uncharacterized protein METZ01_LOCUS70477, partial [marine metagenome]
VSFLTHSIPGPKVGLQANIFVQNKLSVESSLITTDINYSEKEPTEVSKLSATQVLGKTESDIVWISLTLTRSNYPATNFTLQFQLTTTRNISQRPKPYLRI